MYAGIYVHLLIWGPKKREVAATENRLDFPK